MDYKKREEMRLEQNAILSDVFDAALMAYYQHHPSGGPLHITTDDYNCADSHLKFCRNHARAEGDMAAMFLLDILESVEADNREGLIRMAHMGWPRGGEENATEAVNFQCGRCRAHCPQPGPFKFYDMVTCAKCDATLPMYNKQEMFYE